MSRPSKGGGANHLMAWRLHRGLTQAQLAEKVGTTGAVISLLESGDRPLSDKWLRRIGEALKVRPGHLLDFAPGDSSGEVLDLWADVAPARRAEVMEVLRVFRRRE